MFKYLTIFFLSAFIYSCNSIGKKDVGPPVGPEGPVVTSADGGSTNRAGEVEKNDGEHRIVVQEVLNTNRYTYLQVNENEKNFWIAIPRQEVEMGAVYYFSGGLLKKNFKSREFNRVFETLYLVSGITPENGGIVSDSGTRNSSLEQIKYPENDKHTAGSEMISLPELFGNPEKYRGKVIRVSGECIKVNPMIMNRNWVHIRDGSEVDQDLTVTTTDQVHLGDHVSMEGIISLNKDFGAGYQYDVIMENARIVQ